MWPTSQLKNKPMSVGLQSNKSTKDDYYFQLDERKDDIYVGSGQAHRKIFHASHDRCVSIQVKYIQFTQDIDYTSPVQ